MAEDTLTIKLDGKIAIADYAKALHCFDRFVHALAAEEDKKSSITLEVEDLQAGSTMTAAQLESTNSSVVVGTVQRFHDTTQILARKGSLRDHSKRVQLWGKAVAELPKLPSIESARCESALGEAIFVRPNVQPNEGPVTLRYSTGALRGRVETLSRRRGLRFVLYDLLNDTPISCYLSFGQEELMRDSWGRLVLVHGRIGRHEQTWRPEVMRQISEVTVLNEVAPESYLALRGRWQPPVDGSTPEDRIRSMRDDETAAR